jgi:FkbM family methyltransferase
MRAPSSEGQTASGGGLALLAKRRGEWVGCVGVGDPSQIEDTAVRILARLAGALPWGIGQYRVAHPYVQQRRWPPGSERVQRMRSGARFRLDIGDPAQALAYLLRDYGPELRRFIVDHLPPGGTFFDVGSHIGLVAFSVARERPDVTIHAFEPNPSNAARWRENERLNGASSVRLTEAAVSAERGSVPFWVSPSESTSGLIRPGQAQQGDVTVPAIALDQYCQERGIDRIDVLKVDVQGHEAAVLAGASNLLARGAVHATICELPDTWERAQLGVTEEDVTTPLSAAGMVPQAIPLVGLRRLFGNGAAADVAYTLPSRDE